MADLFGGAAVTVNPDGSVTITDAYGAAVYHQGGGLITVTAADTTPATPFPPLAACDLPTEQRGVAPCLLTVNWWWNGRQWSADPCFACQKAAGGPVPRPVVPPAPPTDRETAVRLWSAATGMDWSDPTVRAEVREAVAAMSRVAPCRTPDAAGVPDDDAADVAPDCVVEPPKE